MLARNVHNYAHVPTVLDQHHIGRIIAPDQQIEGMENRDEPRPRSIIQSMLNETYQHISIGQSTWIIITVGAIHRSMAHSNNPWSFSTIFWFGCFLNDEENDCKVFWIITLRSSSIHRN